jgi:uncharacterized protein YndB with AHSA1/START domain
LATIAPLSFQREMLMTNRIAEVALIAGSPEEVWKLITEPTHFKSWYAFGGAEIDLRPGGVMSLRWDEHGVFKAIVESVIHGKLFSFRWQPEPGPLVEITLKLESSGTTHIQIVESGDLEDPEQSALAWRNGLKILKNLAATNGGK